jgi:hypothetical protein
MHEKRSRQTRSQSRTVCVPGVVNKAVAEHREKISPSATQCLAMVARSLTKKVALAKPAAIAAMQEEWQSL